jgi:hypothetical protein
VLHGLLGDIGRHRISAAEWPVKREAQSCTLRWDRRIALKITLRYGWLSQTQPRPKQCGQFESRLMVESVAHHLVGDAVFVLIPMVAVQRAVNHDCQNN